VFLVASVAGGTGGGMLLGLAYAVRQVLGELGLPARGLCGMLLHATSPKPSDQLMARINTCAALTELSHFSQANAPYPGDPEVGLQRFGPGETPFEDCYLVHLGDGLAQADAVAATRNVAEYLFLDSSPEGGAALDRFRQETRPGHWQLAAGGTPVYPPFGADGLLRAFGLAHINAGGAGSARDGARQCCRRLTELWAGPAGGGKDGRDQTYEQEAEREAVAQGLGAEALAAGLNAAVVKHLGESPDSFCTRLTAPEADATSRSRAIERALDKVDELLGGAAGLGERKGTSRTPLTAAVQQKAGELGAKLGTALVDWLLDLVETPGKRVRAAERATAWLGQHLRGLTKHCNGDLTAARNQAYAVRQLLLTGKTGGKGSGIRWLGRSRPPEETQVNGRKLVEYALLRLHEVVLVNALNVLGAVQERLDRFLPDLMLYHQKLKQFAAQFRDKSDEEELSTGLEGDGTKTNPLPAGTLRDFDVAVQRRLLEPQGGLWSVFAGVRALRRSTPRQPESAADPGAAAAAPLSEEALKEELLTRARAFLREALPGRNAAQSFLDDYGSAEEAQPVLLRQLEAATPRLRVEGGREHLLLGVPDGPAKAAVLKAAVEAIPDLPITAVKSEEGLFLVYEGAGYPIREVAAALVGREAPDPELVQRVLTRQDVPWSNWSPAPA
jgi:hypothetical protein